LLAAVLCKMKRPQAGTWSGNLGGLAYSREIIEQSDVVAPAVPPRQGFGALVR
jgi:hypothetical protein